MTSMTLGFPYFWRRAVLGVGLLTVAVLKVIEAGRPHARAGLPQYWFEARTWTLVACAAEGVIAFWILSERWRVASAVCLGSVIAAAAFVLYLQVAGIGVERCGCFGAVRAGIVPHMTVLGAFGFLSMSCILAPRSGRC